MKRSITSIATGAAVALGLTLASTTGAVATQSAPAEVAPTSTSSIVAGQAFAAAAVASDRANGSASPEAVSAVVATAFLTGAASAAGAAVGAWVAGKVIGIWQTESVSIDVAAFD